MNGIKFDLAWNDWGDYQCAGLRSFTCTCGHTNTFEEDGEDWILIGEESVVECSECDRKYMFMYLGLVMEEYLGHMEGV